MLQASDLRAGYGSAAVLHGINLSLAAGERAAILGRNGVGKTTLMRALSGEISSTGGTLTFQGTDLMPLRPHERARLGIAHVPQGRDIFPKLTVAENLKVGAAAVRGSADAKIDEVYDEFPLLAERRRARGGSLSGGQQQILALARALVSEPKLLLLDEPSEGIQPSILDEIAEAIDDINLARGITVLVVEQNLDFAARIAERGLIMDKGEIIENVAIAELHDDRDLQRTFLAL
ncbi:MAG: ABC transporter ATP-binding protein [Acidimicrobiales bacterium]|nr:ABC transporter ATP-binding protein [Acidimicrobiales bacterium]MXX44246.1 ABC transporter ATP-binding protein [Acidimicrobiales bacterium]MYB82821.1 ABC transporter ATP-binding protein [Acidimicrobiales bacterium]MYD34338.1 ABC transporter ATP-binding protein [Acidimicrobiales bacterium]MYI08785.1 ABC transporter ATP-binding protein [Acidimicrobiales bacterium]